MSAAIINLLSQAQQQIKELAADRDACLKRAKRAEEKCANQKREMEVKISRLANEREKLLALIERNS